MAQVHTVVAVVKYCVNINIIGMAGLDYGAALSNESFMTSGSVKSYSRCLDITIREDMALEEDEVFYLILTSQDATIKIGNAKTAITIIDNDSYVAQQKRMLNNITLFLIVDVSMSISSVVGSVKESSRMVQVCVTLSAVEAIERNVNIMLISSDDTGITYSLSNLIDKITYSIAGHGHDYVSVMSNQTFITGSSDGYTRCINISIIDDHVLEDIETFSLRLFNTDPDIVLGDDVALITIIDNDGN